MPATPLAATVLVCESVIEDKDGILSAIRILDVAEVRIPHNVPPESRLINFRVLAVAKFRVETPLNGIAELKFTRPSGETTNAGIDPMPFSIDPNPEAPVGININASISFVAKESGIHKAALWIDGMEAAYTVFTLNVRDPLATAQ